MGENELASSLTLVEKTWEEIVIEIPEDLETTLRPEECIYKAPAAIRDLNEAAYTPQVISIGPFHHDSENLKGMETQKMRYLKDFWKRLRGQPKEQVDESMKELLTIILYHEKGIKRQYPGSSFEISSKRFLKMILLDGVFILELFLKNKECSGRETMYKGDFIIGNPLQRAAIQRDLILLENQLPFFILEELYDHATRTSTSYCMATYPPFLDLSYHYFENYGKSKNLPGLTKQYKPMHFTDLVRYFLAIKHPTLESPDGKQYKPWHFTDLVRCFLPFMRPKLEPPDGKQLKNPYSATMLHQAGIKFKANLRAECLLDIRAWGGNVNPAIKNGELHIPQLEIDIRTECLFRNLMALEQCHYPGQEFICRYVKLLDILMHEEEDVDLLIENKVIVSRIGNSKAVAGFINKLCQEIEVTSGYDALSDLLNNYYERYRNKNIVARLISKLCLEIVEVTSGFDALSDLLKKNRESSWKKNNVWIGTGIVIGLIILAIAVARLILSFFR